MPILPILQIGHPTLRERALEVSRDELASAQIQQFIDDLIDTMRAANGAGLAAIQVGRRIRICAIEVKDNPRYPYKPNVPLTILVNPVLTHAGADRFDNFEGCLSVPNLRGVASRACELRVTALDRHGAPIDRLVRGVTAGTFQHEVDHLDGILFVDRVEDTKTLCTWDEFKERHEPAFAQSVRELVARYGS